MAKTGGNIYKRGSDGRWEARLIISYNENGKANYKSFYGKSRQEAKIKRDVYSAERTLGIETTSAPMILFSKLVENWLQNVKLRIKESTYARYYNQVHKHILLRFGKYQASKISTEMVEYLVNDLLKILAPKTVGDILILVKSIFKFGKLHAALKLDRIKIKKENKPPKIISESEQIKLFVFLSGVANLTSLGILLCMRTGLRIGELCALRWGNIDLENKVIHVKHTVQRIQIVDGNDTSKTKVITTTPKSKNSAREIPISDLLTAIFRNFKKDDNCFLLTGIEKRMEPRNLQYHFKRILNQCGIRKYNFHAIRHTFATNYIKDNGDAKSLSEILGHSSVKITLEKYVHPSPETKRANIEKTESRFNLLAVVSAVSQMHEYAVHK